MGSEPDPAWRRETSARLLGARHHANEHAPAVQAGHLQSFHSGAPERLALEDADRNQLKNWTGAVILLAPARDLSSLGLMTKPAKFIPVRVRIAGTMRSRPARGSEPRHRPQRRGHG